MALVGVTERMWSAVFPRFCVACNREGVLLCRTCDEAWTPTRPATSFENDAGEHDIRDVFALLPYADPIARELITSWKYQFDASAWQILQRRLAPQGASFALTLGMRRVEAIVPLPLTNKRRCERGFDQAVEIARWLGHIAGVPVLPLLARRHRAGHQADRTVDERQSAMANSPFVIPTNAEGSLPKCILLVDDVWTTGATMDAGARTLKAVGVEEVFGFALAKGK